MGWTERGKKGVHSGRTLRQNHRLSSVEGVIVKYQTNTANISNSVTTSLLQDRYGLTDGLNVKYIPHLREDTGVHFSLGKRKRWLLPDLVKERVSDEEITDGEEFEAEDEKEVHICFTERHIYYDNKRSRGDCVSIYSDHDGQIAPKHKYSYYSDFRHQDKNTKPPEIGYEICQSPPSTSWPNFSEGQQSYRCEYWGFNGKKSKGKRKGMKNKGYRWGMFRDGDDLAKCIDEDWYVNVQQRQSESKIKTVNSNDFLYAAKKVDTTRDGHAFRLDDYTNAMKKRDTGKVKEEKSLDVTSEFKKYGKGCAMYVGSVAKQPEEVKMPQESQMKSLRKRHTVTINIDAKDLEVSSVQSEWGDCYVEGAVYPRKFAVNITALLPNKLKANIISNVLFELQDQPSKDNTQVTTVSVVHVSVGYQSELYDAAQDFAAYITRTTDSCRIWQVKEVIKAALQCIRVLTGLCGETVHVQPQTEKTGKTRSVSNLNLLDKMCGWRSEPFTLQEAQQQIKEQLENEAKISKSSDVAQWMILSMECGICYETFEGDPDNSPVTRLMDNFTKNKVPEKVQEAMEFEFQARLVLEGFAQKAAVSRGHV
ncbi:hypothetical protein QZH41_017150, partial [Actinostola sp. cb2023]